jgi:hypothetical protein
MSGILVFLPGLAFPIAAVTSARKALARIEHSIEPTGETMANLGLVTGYIGLVVQIVLLGLYLTFARELFRDNPALSEHWYLR